MAPPLQVKLLRAIQEKRVRKVGATGAAPADVRTISAPPQDLAQCVAAGRFRQDLYYRLHVIELQLPALRERREDIPVLAEAVRKARENVREGESIAEPLRRSGLFPPVVVQMVSVGEKSGELEKMLLKVSDSFDRTVESRIAALMSLLEPVIILVMGLVVGLIVIAILLPILQMSSAVR